MQRAAENGFRGVGQSAGPVPRQLFGNVGNQGRTGRPEIVGDDVGFSAGQAERVGRGRRARGGGARQRDGQAIDLSGGCRAAGCHHRAIHPQLRRVSRTRIENGNPFAREFMKVHRLVDALVLNGKLPEIKGRQRGIRLDGVVENDRGIGQGGRQSRDGLTPDFPVAQNGAQR